MESMDYQMESPTASASHFDPSIRRCPYSFSQSQGPGTIHYYNGLQFVPAQYISQLPPIVPHNILPAPTTSTYMTNPHHFTHFSTDTFNQGLREQLSLQQDILMAERNRSVPRWLEAGDIVGAGPQTPRRANERTRSDPGSGSIETTSNQYILPPIARSFLTPAPNPAAQPARAQRGLVPLPTWFHGRDSHTTNTSPPSSTTSSENLEQDSFLFDRILQRTEGLEDFVNNNVPALAGDSNLPTDDPRRLQNQADRRAFLRAMLRPEKTGASKGAIESLYKVSIEDIKKEKEGEETAKEDLMCSICYNDYGVANLEGLVEHPLRIPRCQHIFGNVCLKKWLEEHATCPICRKKVLSPGTTERKHGLGDRETTAEAYTSMAEEWRERDRGADEEQQRFVENFPDVEPLEQQGGRQTTRRGQNAMGGREPNAIVGRQPLGVGAFRRGLGAFQPSRVPMVQDSNRSTRRGGRRGNGNTNSMRDAHTQMYSMQYPAMRQVPAGEQRMPNAPNANGAAMIDRPASGSPSSEVDFSTWQNHYDESTRSVISRPPGLSGYQNEYSGYYGAPPPSFPYMNHFAGHSSNYNYGQVPTNYGTGSNQHTTFYHQGHAVDPVYPPHYQSQQPIGTSSIPSHGLPLLTPETWSSLGLGFRQGPPPHTRSQDFSSPGPEPPRHGRASSQELSNNQSASRRQTHASGDESTTYHGGYYDDRLPPRPRTNRNADAGLPPRPRTNRNADAEPSNFMNENAENVDPEDDDRYSRW